MDLARGRPDAATADAGGPHITRPQSLPASGREAHLRTGGGPSGAAPEGRVECEPPRQPSRGAAWTAPSSPLRPPNQDASSKIDWLDELHENNSHQIPKTPPTTPHLRRRANRCEPRNPIRVQSAVLHRLEQRAGLPDAPIHLPFAPPG